MKKSKKKEDNNKLLCNNKVDAGSIKLVKLKKKNKLQDTINTGIYTNTELNNVSKHKIQLENNNKTVDFNNKQNKNINDYKSYTAPTKKIKSSKKNNKDNNNIQKAIKVNVTKQNSTTDIKGTNDNTLLNTKNRLLIIDNDNITNLTNSTFCNSNVLHDNALHSAVYNTLHSNLNCDNNTLCCNINHSNVSSSNVLNSNIKNNHDLSNNIINKEQSALLIPKKHLKCLEDLLQYTFKNKELLRSALRHSSIKKSAIPFERLEFLGDRILGVIIAEYIYSKTTGNEGEMAKMHSAFVCAESCYEVAVKLGVNNIIKTAGQALHNNKTVLADAMEAILGAIFTDSKNNYKIVENIVIRLWKPIFKKYKEEDQEPKTQLQEIVQAVTNEVPLYTLLSETGPKHHPIFTVSVTALGKTIQASGFSKKEAETKAAKELLNKLHERIK